MRKTLFPSSRFIMFITVVISAIPFPTKAGIMVEEPIPEHQQYVHEHPSLRSLVFISPQMRRMAIMPPPPVFVPPPLLFFSSASPAHQHATASPRALADVHAANRFGVALNLHRAHNFSQNLSRSQGVFAAVYSGLNAGVYAGFGGYYPAYEWFAYSGIDSLVRTAGFNQPARPGNRANVRYNLERAHRFSTDGYRRP